MSRRISCIMPMMSAATSPPPAALHRLAVRPDRRRRRERLQHGVALRGLARELRLRFGLPAHRLHFRVGLRLVVRNLGLRLVVFQLQIRVARGLFGIGLLLGFLDAVRNVLLRGRRERRILEQREPGCRREHLADNRQDLLQHGPGEFLLVRRGRALVNDDVILRLAVEGVLFDERHKLRLFRALDFHKGSVRNVKFDDVQHQPALFLPVAPEAIEQRL